MKRDYFFSFSPNGGANAPSALFDSCQRSQKQQQQQQEEDSSGSELVHYSGLSSRH